MSLFNFKICLLDFKKTKEEIRIDLYSHINNFVIQIIILLICEEHISKFLVPHSFKDQMFVFNDFNKMCRQIIILFIMSFCFLGVGV